MRNRFLAILGILCWNVLHAQDSLTLQKVVQFAIQRNDAIKRAELDVEIMRERGRAEKSIIYPQLSTQLSLDYYPILPTSLVPGEFVNQPGTFIPVQFGQPWQAQGGLSVQQLIYNEAYRRAIPAREMSVELNKILLQKSKEEIAMQVAQLYLQIKQTELAGIALASQEKRLEALERSVKASLENGFTIKTDLTRVQLAQQQIQAQKQNLTAALEYQRALLGFLTGQDIKADQPLAAPSIALPATQQLRPVSDQMALKQGMALQNLQLHSAKAERYPDIRAYANGLAQTQRATPNVFGRDGRWFGLGVVGLRVQMPITDGGRLSSRLRQISLDLRKNQLTLTQSEELQKIEVARARSEITSETTQLALATKSVALAKEVFEGMRRQYQEGTQPLREVLDAQAALAEAETTYATKQISVELAELKWLKVAGYLSILFE